MTPLPLVQFNRANQRINAWSSTNFAALEGKVERDLEGMIACDLATLGIEELARTDLKYQILRQCQLPRQMASTIKPDIVVIREDGELFIIEVKVGTNAELFDRKAIGQVIEYASAISQLSEAELANMLDRENKGLNLGELFDYWFITPDYKTPYRVQNARKLVNNIASGNINLFIVSDVLPSGAYNWIDEWSTQSHLPFNFSAIEVTPFVNKHDDSLLLVPQTKIETAIISRTVVEVKQMADVTVPRISVSSADEVIESTKPKKVKKYHYHELLKKVCDRVSTQSSGWRVNRNNQWEQVIRNDNSHNCIFRIYTQQDPMIFGVFFEYDKKAQDPQNRIGNHANEIKALIPKSESQFFVLDSQEQGWRKIGLRGFILDLSRVHDDIYAQEIAERLMLIDRCMVRFT